MIAARPDLLAVGGLTVDRLADGSLVAGGSVLHAARAAATTGRRVASITAAGLEAEAALALAELASLGASQVQPAASSIHFAISDATEGRRLLFESAGAPVLLTDSAIEELAPSAVLLAPVAGELSAAALVATRAVAVRVAALQGWLRTLVPGEAVAALRLTALAKELTAALGDLDALVASEEDLAAAAAEPALQLSALRRHFGARPLLVVTQGAGGAWLEAPSGERHHVEPATRLVGISTIGAGDAFAAFLALGLRSALEPVAAVGDAVAATAEFLARRSD